MRMDYGLLVRYKARNRQNKTVFLFWVVTLHGLVGRYHFRETYHYLPWTRRRYISLKWRQLPSPESITTQIIKITAFWDVALCSLTEIAFIIGAMISLLPQYYIPESCPLHTRHHENLKSHPDDVHCYENFKSHRTMLPRLLWDKQTWSMWQKSGKCFCFHSLGTVCPTLL
jgi:hypothetical protein